VKETVGNESDDRSGGRNGCPSLDELLPGPGNSGPEGDLAAHVAGCATCASLLRARALIARELHDLTRSRVAAPRGALDFGLVMAAVDDRLDAELVRAEARWRPLVAPLPRSPMPAAAAAATLAAFTSAPRLLREARVRRLVRHSAALAAAAGVVAAALLARAGAPGAADDANSRGGGLEAEAALLTRGEPLGVEIVAAEPGAAAAAGVRSLGRGGAPRLEPIPAARPPKNRGGP
jgi:hypothetical protein